MKIICYAFKNDNNELESPFLNYLEKYALKPTGSDKKRQNSLKQIANIEAHLTHLLDHKGKYNLPPVAQKYKDQNIGILKIKEGNKLIRVAFFTQVKQNIVLLDVIQKPKLYQKNQKRNVDKMIQNFLNRAEKYRQDYLHKNLFLPLNF